MRTDEGDLDRRNQDVGRGSCSDRRLQGILRQSREGIYQDWEDESMR